jgi:hypothetical protein
VNKDKVRQQLQSLVGTRKKVRLTRGFPSEPRVNGFVVAIGREWALLEVFHDFYSEGYTAIQVRGISDIRSGEYERHWEQMLAAEGLLDRIAVPSDVPLDGIAQLLKALQRRGQNVIIECEDPDENVQDFYIGQILSVDKDSVCFANFDALGRWDDDPHAIPFREISKVQFETPYVQKFSKYLKGPYRPTRRCSRPDRA